MKSRITWPFFLIAIMMLVSCKNKVDKKPVVDATTHTNYYTEPYRPQYHFTPEKMWMNDPNGMVYNDGIYHLFYQYYPDDIVWGPMHWGHAISKDLIHWEHRPIALYPDELGYIFSGSAVLDKENTSGFGTEDNPPLVAIYTYHDTKGEKGGRLDFQTQGVAYSLDNGESWTKYEKNPVIGNEGIRDFRDPKVLWHEASKRWVLSLVAGDHAQFYSSENLREWKLTGVFGKDKGAHGGVWECPDLFKLKVEGTDEEKWVLLISINPGAPNGGSGTQYFIGDFDGEKFTTNQTETLWIDWGTDNYAGVTWSNAPNNEKIFIGWMSNWTYARDTPTEKWRSAMTLPQKLSLEKVGNNYELFNYPIDQLKAIIDSPQKKDIKIEVGGKENIAFDHFNQAEVRFATTSEDFVLTFKNSKDEKLVLTMNGKKKLFSLDRTLSGKTNFQEDFGKKIQQMPIPALPNRSYEVRILMDWSSVEVFINKGQYVMTAQLFPNEAYTDLIIENSRDGTILLQDFAVGEVQRIW